MQINLLLHVAQLEMLKGQLSQVYEVELTVYPDMHREQTEELEQD